MSCEKNSIQSLFNFLLHFWLSLSSDKRIENQIKAVLWAFLNQLTFNSKFQCFQWVLYPAAAFSWRDISAGFFSWSVNVLWQLYAVDNRKHDEYDIFPHKKGLKTLWEKKGSPEQAKSLKVFKVSSLSKSWLTRQHFFAAIF